MKSLTFDNLIWTVIFGSIVAVAFHVIKGWA